MPRTLRSIEATDLSRAWFGCCTRRAMQEPLRPDDLLHRLEARKDQDDGGV